MPIITDPKEGHRNYSNIYEYACWADEARTSDNTTWHYYEIPFYDEGYYKPVILNKTHNVAWAVNTAKDTLMGKNTGYDKSAMMRNLIHFMGDAHQPLYVATTYTKKYPDGDYIDYITLYQKMAICIICGIMVVIMLSNTQDH